MLLFIDDGFSSSSNDMIAARFVIADFRSLVLFIVGTAMIISLFCRGDADSAIVVSFNSMQSTVIAKRIDPRPNSI